MTEEEAVLKLKKIEDGSWYKENPSFSGYTGYDAENQHGDADEVLLDFLRSKGYTKIIEAWVDVPKWYA